MTVRLLRLTELTRLLMSPGDGRLLSPGLSLETRDVVAPGLRGGSSTISIVAFASRGGFSKISTASSDEGAQ